ncbi:MAG: type pantothenate kinase, partial [Thermoanaerobaculia bacterium]|nr:type pantothenate kinase [Thermoanaerobaculia bacterium]
YAAMPEDEAIALAKAIWEQINLANLHENILPTRERARLILGKGASHVVERVLLRRT